MMNKKVLKKKVKSSNIQQTILLFVLIILFTLTFFCSLYYIGKYYQDGNPSEVIKINHKKNQLLITNNSEIEKVVKEEDFLDNQDDIIIENVDTIELIPNKHASQEVESNFNVRYSISENSFLNNINSSNNSPLLVRFSYSYDNENWNYVNNVISTTESNLSPLMGNFYDISGLVSSLKVGTNYKIASEPGKKTKIYWKTETLIKNNGVSIGKKIKASFKIEYQNN